MKLLNIVFSRLYYYFVSNKLIFIIFAVGLLVSSTALVYFYGNATEFKTTEAKDSYSYELYAMELDKPVNQENLNTGTVPKDNILDIEVVHKLSKDEFTEKSKYTETFFVKTKTLNADNIHGMRGRTAFSKQEIQNAEKVIIIPRGFDDKNMGDTIQIAGYDYKIIGVATDHNAFYIPVTVYKQCFSVDSFSILLKDKLTIEDNNAYINSLQQAYPNGKITESPSFYYERAKEQLPLNLIMLGIFYAVAIVSFLFAMKFMVDKNSKENIIYSIVGASKRTVIKILLVENMVLSSCIAILAIILHISLYDVLFKNINTLDKITYTIGDYGIIFIVILAFSTLATLPFIFSYYKHTVKENINKYSTH